MPCKHEGGEDPCIHSTGSRNCKVGKAQYDRAYLGPAGIPATKGHSSDKGAAAEHFVIADLLNRGLKVGGPYNQNGKDDLFVKVNGKWRTVQVKSGRRNRKTGTLVVGTRRNITSDLVAFVDTQQKEIRWISNTRAEVPAELTLDPS